MEQEKTQILELISYNRQDYEKTDGLPADELCLRINEDRVKRRATEAVRLVHAEEFYDRAAQEREAAVRLVDVSEVLAGNLRLELA